MEWAETSPDSKYPLLYSNERNKYFTEQNEEKPITETEI